MDQYIRESAERMDRLMIAGSMYSDFGGHYKQSHNADFSVRSQEVIVNWRQGRS